jgi:hypothetical protein
MKLYADKESVIKDIKNVFSTCYPFLRIEFYNKPYAENHSLQKRNPLPGNFTLQQAMKVKGKGEIDISSSKTIAELGKDLASFGLFAEVFRRSGNVWVETSLTREWTLQQQNLEGEEISKIISKTG